MSLDGDKPEGEGGGKARGAVTGASKTTESCKKPTDNARSPALHMFLADSLEMAVQLRLLQGIPAPPVAVKVAEMEALVKAFEDAFARGTTAKEETHDRRGVDLMQAPK